MKSYSLLSENVPANASEVISGGAEGADKLAERYAREKNLRLTIHLPDYSSEGAKAPLSRNETIVDEADYVVALWDGKSRGTSHVIRLCIERNKPFKIVKI
jgi:hypothetical protein